MNQAFLAIELSPALQASVATGVFGIVLLALTRFSNRQDRKGEYESRLAEKTLDLDARLLERREEAEEWYRRELFNRRLNAANEATGWLFKIQTVYGKASEEQTKESKLEVLDVLEAASDWWLSNALFLYGDFPPLEDAFSVFVGAAIDAVGSGDFKTLLPDVKQAEDEIRRLVRDILSIPAIDQAVSP